MDKTTAELMEHQAAPSSTDSASTTDQVPMAFSHPVDCELPHGQTQPITQSSAGQPAKTPQGQPIQYSGGQPVMNPQGQPIQYSGGQPVMTPQGQPIQYSGGQPVMNPQGQPIQYSGGQPVMNPQGQPIQYSGGQPVMNPQGQPIQYSGGQPVQPVRQQAELDVGQPQPQVGPGKNVRMNTTYLKSGASIAKIFECVLLIIAWVCIDNYIKRVYWIDEATSFFRGITIFCLIVVFIIQAIFAADINNHRCAKPSRCVLVVIAMQLLLSALMISCSVKLALRANEVKLFAQSRSFMSFGLPAIASAFLLASLAVGFIICLSFLDDIHLFYKLYKSERAKEDAANVQNVQLQNASYPEPQPPAADRGTAQL